jgi:hypothetical protein
MPYRLPSVHPYIFCLLWGEGGLCLKLTIGAEVVMKTVIAVMLCLSITSVGSTEVLTPRTYIDRSTPSFHKERWNRYEDLHIFKKQLLTKTNRIAFMYSILNLQLGTVDTFFTVRELNGDQEIQLLDLLMRFK